MKVEHGHRARGHRAADGDGAAGGRPARARRRPRPGQPAVGLGRADGGGDEPLPGPRAARRRLLHPAMAVQLDACIQCNLCVRACREVQVNDVIGMACRGHHEQIVFDQDDPMGAVHLRRLRRVRPGLPDRGADADAHRRSTATGRGARAADREVDSVCPYLRRRLPDHLPRQGRQDRLRHRPRRPGQREPAVRQGPVRLRLRPQPAAADQAADPQATDAPKRPSSASTRATPGRISARRAGTRRWRSPPRGLRTRPRPRRRRRAGRLRLGQVQQRGGLPVPEAGPHRLRHQQCRPLHAAVPRLARWRR